MNDDEIARHKSKKNTKKWCRGKPGVPHEGVAELSNKIGVDLRCKNCAKQLAWWWPIAHWEEPPPWVPKSIRIKARQQWDAHNSKRNKRKQKLQ